MAIGPGHSRIAPVPAVSDTVTRKDPPPREGLAADSPSKTSSATEVSLSPPAQFLLQEESRQRRQGKAPEEIEEYDPEEASSLPAYAEGFVELYSSQQPSLSPQEAREQALKILGILVEAPHVHIPAAEIPPDQRRSASARLRLSRSLLELSRPEPGSWVRRKG